MSVRGILISLAVNFAVAGTVWYLKGPNAGLVCLAIGFLLFVAALLWPKKKTEPEPPPPPLSFAPIIKQEANPHIQQTVIVHKDPPATFQRSAAEEYDFNKAKNALLLLKEPGVIALRYLRSQGSITFSFAGYTSASLPAGLTPQTALSIYRACASEGILSSKKNRGNTEETFTILPSMEKVLNELLFTE